MIWALAAHTLRECQRRPFPYVAAAAVVMLSLASQLLHAFSFGAGAQEASNLAISAVFLVALANAAFVGTALVRTDLERGTMALLLSQPVTLPAYLAGRFLGLAVASLALCALTATGAAGAVLVTGAPREALGAPLLLGWCRVALAALVLDAGALAFSAAASRLFAPLLVLALFLAGDAAASSPIGRLLPSFGAFAFEAQLAPPWAWLVLYALLYCGVFLLAAYLLLASRPPTRTES